MEHIYPSYYNDFHCIAGRCPDSCCREWDVQVDEDTAANYRSLEGPLGDALRSAMYEEDGDTYLGHNQEGRCPLWQPDGLCRVQCTLGHDALSQVCQEFPRIKQDYGPFIEHDLEMSCPEAARIMLSSKEWSLTTSATEEPGEPECDEELMALLQRTRPVALSLMADTRFSMGERLAILLMYGYHIQAQIDGAEETPFDPTAALEEARGFAGAGNFPALLDTFRNLEILTDRWKDLLDNPHAAPSWFDCLRQLSQYGIYRYYYQAVSDYDLVCRIKFIVTYCIMAAFLCGDDFASQVSCIQLFSKEIENDSENMDALLDGAYTCPGLTDSNLLGLLLQ